MTQKQDNFFQEIPLGDVIRGSDPSGQLYWENLLSKMSLPPRIRALLRTLTPQLMSEYLTKQSQMADYWYGPNRKNTLPGMTAPDVENYMFEDYLGGLDISKLIRQTMSQFPQVTGPRTPSAGRTRAY